MAVSGLPCSGSGSSCTSPATSPCSRAGGVSTATRRRCSAPGRCSGRCALGCWRCGRGPRRRPRSRWRARARAARAARRACAGARAATLGVAHACAVGGVLLLAFIVFHVLHLTTGGLHPDFAPGSVYDNLVRGLAATPMVARLHRGGGAPRAAPVPWPVTRAAHARPARWRRRARGAGGRCVWLARARDDGRVRSRAARGARGGAAMTARSTPRVTGGPAGRALGRGAAPSCGLVGPIRRAAAP